MTTKGRRTDTLTRTMTPSRQLMTHLFGEDAPAIRRALLELGPTSSDDPVDQLINAMAEAEFASHMEDLARRAKERPNSPDAVGETDPPTPLLPTDDNVIPISVNARRNRPPVLFLSSYQRDQGGLHQKAAARHRTARTANDYSDEFSITWEQDSTIWELKGRRNNTHSEVILTPDRIVAARPRYLEWRAPYRDDVFDKFPVRGGSTLMFYVDVELGVADIRIFELKNAKEVRHEKDWELRLPIVLFDGADGS